MKTEKIIIAGFGGQGIITLGYIIAFAGMLDGFNVSHIPSYGAEMRGGTANCSVVVSQEEIASPIISEATTAIIMNQPSIIKFEKKIAKNGLLILNSDMINKLPQRKDLRIVSVSANREAERIGSLKSANIFMGGIFAGLTKIINFESFKKAIKEYFKTKSSKIIDLNLKAFEEGIKFCKKI